MYQLDKYVNPELVVVGIAAESKKDVIKTLIERLHKVDSKAFGALSVDAAVQEVLNREKLQTTGVGEGVAFPHARIEGWTKFSVVIGILENGIDFGSIDAVPVRFVCLMISSSDEPYIVLQTMAAIVRALKQNEQAKYFFKNQDPKAIVQELVKYQSGSAKTILAQDIMRPVKKSVKLIMPIEKVARIMHLNGLDVLPVVDENNVFCGVVTCFQIFNYGLPDFFKQLHTISFVRYFDPFEKYFKFRRALTVKDIFCYQEVPIASDTTLAEIVFRIAVKNHQKLFVVNGGHLIGEIDRFSLIDKVLFF
ncbi:MAG: PTS sugar transporter subunit IIA [Candidatus Omnitrophota bacterium]